MHINSSALSVHSNFPELFPKPLGTRECPHLVAIGSDMTRQRSVTLVQALRCRSDGGQALSSSAQESLALCPGLDG